MYEYMAIGKSVMTTKHPRVMKKFSEDNGVIYVDRPEGALNKAVKLIGNENIKEKGRKARRFVERYNLDVVVGAFEGILGE
jgi:fructose-bisphosphate aldolase class 1